MAAPHQSAAFQDFILAFNGCPSPKEALRLLNEISKVFTASVSVHGDSVQVRCTSLSGSLLEECDFSVDAPVAELEAKMQDKLSGEELPSTSLTFLTDDGSEVEKAQRLKDHTRLTIKTSVSPDDVSKLMYMAGESVSVELLGQCLGNHGEFWKQLALSYPQNFACFNGMEVVEAMRAYLWRFRLPGEAAQIERIVDGFARSYFHFNEEKKEEEEEVIDKSSESGEEGEEPVHSRSCWEAGVTGWYVHQPLSGPKNLPCCVHCGALDDNAGLAVCQGCNVIHFCRKCRRSASRYGHAVVGTLGYGRACVAAKSAIGSLGPDLKITYTRNMHGAIETSVVSGESLNWTRVSPFRTEDSVMVLAYAIIMLTTNLHSANVKEKMKKHEFIRQNNGVNGDSNFPGDFLAKIYDDILKEELKVMRKAD